MNYKTMSDKQLLWHFGKTNSQKAIDTLFERHYESLVEWIMANYVADETAAENAANNTFVKVREKCREFHLNQSFLSWLYRIAGNVVICGRGNKTKEQPRKTSKRMLGALNGLPETERQVLTLLLLDNVTDSAAAKQLGITCRRLHQIYDSALAKFKREMIPC